MAGITTTTTNNTVLKGITGTTGWSDRSMTFYVGTPDDTDLLQTARDAAGFLGPASTYNFETEINRAFELISGITGLPLAPVATSAASSAVFVIFGIKNLRDQWDQFEGQFDFPGTNTPENRFGPGDYRSFGVLNATDYYMTGTAETGGGRYAWWSVTHEILHGFGLAHPHDKGNGSTRTSGTLPDLDNEMYTVMSYDEAARDARSFGHAVTPMALDIAALQEMYGKDTSWNDGNSTYRLTDARSAAFSDQADAVTIGRAYYGIWDGGGTDAISYKGSNSALINLNTATLGGKLPAGLGGQISEIKASAIWSKLGALQVGPVGGGTRNMKQDFDSDYFAGGFFSRVMVLKNGVYKGVDGGYSIAKGARIEKAIGGVKQDLLIGNQFANQLNGKGGNDFMFGGNGADVIRGDGGRDTMSGGNGADSLFGGAGRDKIKGGTGADTLVGGGGRDVLNGGFGADTFTFNSVTDSRPGTTGRDLIANFIPGFDEIDLSAIDANTGAPGDQAFSFIGTAAFSGTAGELRMAHPGSQTVISGDTNGDGKADFAVAIAFGPILSASDFIL